MEMDTKSMKVAELKDELTARGLSTKGLKKELLERLEDALGSDRAQADEHADGQDGQKSPEPVENPVKEVTEENTNGHVAGDKPVEQPAATEPEQDVVTNTDAKAVEVTPQAEANGDSKAADVNGTAPDVDDSQDIQVEMDIEVESVPEKAIVEPASIDAEPLTTALDETNAAASQSDARGDKRKRDEDMEVDEASKPAQADVKRRRGSETRPPGLEHTIHPPTSSLYITNLRRPLLQPQLIEYLSSIVTLSGDAVPSLPDGVWVDGVKSHCYALYATTEDAIKAAKEIHGKKWPEDMGQDLHVEFVETDQVERLVTSEKVAWVNGRSKLSLRIEENDDGFKFELVPAGTPLNAVGRNGAPPRIPPIASGHGGPRTGPVATGVNAIRPGAGAGPSRAPPPHLSGPPLTPLKRTRTRPSLTYCEGPGARGAAPAGRERDRPLGGRAPLPPQSGPGGSGGWGRRGGGLVSSHRGGGGSFPRRERWDSR